jgi:membrane protease subunit (stomatin/prohibitin family)|tara:strand:+ start:875 stop:1858 length:984 start_codon:yes stop_codon:yes gene_type:complete
MPKLMEILEYVDPTGEVMVKRLPDSGEYEITYGSQLIVRESQVAIFFRDGRSLDVFTTGRHVLKTQNLPVLTKLITGLGYGKKESVFKSEVYFINMKLFRNLKWGTSEPILFKDDELQMIRLRGFGIFSIQIDDPSLFLNKVVGTQGIFISQEIENYLKNIIVARLTSTIGNFMKTIFELPSNFDELSISVRLSIQAEFEGLGLKIHDYLINSISVPPEVQEMIDTRSGMAAVGNMNEFVKYKAAMSLQDAAQNPSGAAAAGVGIGAGMGMGFMLPQMLSGAMQDSGSQGVTITPMDKLKSLKELLDMGALSQEEYDSKKEKLLGEF